MNIFLFTFVAAIIQTDKPTKMNEIYIATPVRISSIPFNSRSAISSAKAYPMTNVPNRTSNGNLQKDRKGLAKLLSTEYFASIIKKTAHNDTPFMEYA